ncbi:MAG TPA: ComEC/Rec2 family competence protein [Candidatus Limnocylindria bacterium]|nr:ComEC/Rec2 family competence protein [Candidatus Limnocylindria bacterium]
MPRSGWVAVGAVSAALAGSAVASAVSAAPRFPIAMVIVAGAVPLAVVAYRRGSRRAMAAMAGALLVGLRLIVAGDAGMPEPSAIGLGDTEWTGLVVAVSAPRDGRQVAFLELAPGGRDGTAGRAGPAGSAMRTAATLPRYPPVRPGQQVRVSGRLEPVPVDDYGRYLARIGVAATVRARSLEVTGEDAGPGNLVERIRRAGDEALTRVLPEPEAGLASGIIVGLRERVDRDLAAAFTAAGVSHVVAISGWNIAIVGATVAALLRRWPRRRRSAAILLAVIAYTVLTGASASVLRAATMAVVVLLARESGRAGHASAALGWAVVGVLAADPGYVVDPGFALSAAATGGLIAWATPLTERLAGWQNGRLPRWLCESLAVSIAAEAATLPIALAWFGRFALLAPIVNLLVVPLVAPAMAAGGLALVAGGAAMLSGPGPVAVAFGLPAWAALGSMVGIVRAVSALPFASITLEPPANVAAAVAAAGCVVTIAHRDRLRRALPGGGLDPAGNRTIRMDARPADGTPQARRQRATHRPRLSTASRLVGAGLAATVAAVVLIVSNRPDGTVHLTVLDVGQGDAILVEGDRGGRMLVDGGPDPDRLLIQLDAHVPPWDRRLDLVILTHPHEDHVGGLPLLLMRYRVGRVMEPGMIGPGPGYQAWQAELQALGTKAGRLATGDGFTLDGIAFRVLWPDRGGVPIEPADSGTAINNVSIVLLGTFDRERFLLAGDIEEEIDPVLLERGLPSVEVLKVAHHGSRTSSTSAFLDAVRPRIGLVSVGLRNTYGHPAPATIERLRTHGVRVLRTDLDGTVDVSLDGTRATVHAEGARPQRASTPGAARPGSPIVGIACAVPRAASTARARAPAEFPPARARAAVHSSLLYHRPDDGSRTGRRRLPPALPGPVAAVHPSRSGRRRGGRLACPPDRGGRHLDRPQVGRVRGAAPRRRQGAAARRPGTGSPPRRRLGRLAHSHGPPGAGQGRCCPPGDPPRRRGAVPALVGLCEPRGAGRGLRRQARRAARGTDGGAVREVGATPPRTGRLEPSRPGARGADGVGAMPGGRDPPRRPSPSRLDRPRAGRRPAATVGSGGWAQAVRRSPGTTVTARDSAGGPGGSAIGYFWGDDGYGLDRAAAGIGERLAAAAGIPPERWNISGAEVSAARIGERVATATLFGGGTLAVVSEPSPLFRSRDGREALTDTLRMVAPGNGLVFIELLKDLPRPRDPDHGRQAFVASVRAAGGEARLLAAPNGGALVRWIEERARERSIGLGQGTAAEIARRLGGLVREGDVDRRRQGQLAVAEIEKLSLLHVDGGEVTMDDVRALVAEAVPGSAFAFLDAIGERRSRDGTDLLERLLESTPEPVVLAQIYGRIRQLLDVADRLAAGQEPRDLATGVKVHPFVLEKLVRQAHAWSVDELEAALGGLLELDILVKGANGTGSTETGRRLAFTLWLADHVARVPGGMPARARSANAS